MQIFGSIAQLRAWTSHSDTNGCSIGLVPTMGCLHNGHERLLNEARANNDRVLLCIFINPLQFHKNNYSQYPRRTDDDIKIAQSCGADAIFMPSVETMYPQAPSLDWLFTLQDGSSGQRHQTEFSTNQVGAGQLLNYVRVPDHLVMRMDGQAHPWHFDGVATVVRKLFEIVSPTRAYFGQKDIQQIAILEAMNQWLNTGIEIVQIPVVRDQDGLSSSSRLVLLDMPQRSIAVAVTQLIERLAKKSIDRKSNADDFAAEFMAGVDQIYTHGNALEIDSIEIVNPTTLDQLNQITPPAAIYVAYLINGIRLAETRWY